MSKIKTITKWFIITMSVFIIAFFGLTISYVSKLNKSVEYNNESLQYLNSQIQIVDCENNDFSDNSEQKSLVKLEELPSYVPASFISIEDKNFYNHNGLNYKRMIKAILKNLTSGKLKEGASTISQQLIKNTHLSSEKTIDRKVKEILLTRKMEKKLSKEEILETYLNVIYFGNGSYGLESASENYFNKKAKELTIEESAMLAGLIKSPKLYSPLYNIENCLKRRNIVLREMLNDGKINADEYNIAVGKSITLNENNKKKNKNFYEQAVMEQACEILNISEKDLVKSGCCIFTYLNKKDQESLKETLYNTNLYHQNSFGNIADSAGMIIDNKTGGITAFAGKSVYDIVNMKRSPGSAIKPILVYAPALDEGVVSPSTMILDEKMSFGDYSPSNVGNQYYGWISTRQTLEKSLNIPAIKIMQYTGMKKCKEMAEKCGIHFSSNDENYAIALGGLTEGLTVKQLVNSYIPLSNGGKFINASFIRKICDKNGNVVYENKPIQKQVFSEETACLLTDMLQSSVKKGTSSRLNVLPFEIAGKTGTVGIKGSNNNSDVWSVAYTTDKTAGIWLGNSTNDKEYVLEGKNNGGTYCSTMLKQVFEKLYENSKPSDFSRNEKVLEVEIDAIELENNHVLKLVDENTPDIFKIKSLFNKKYVPKEKATSFSELSIVKLNVNMAKNQPKLSFVALPQVEYKIYRIEEDQSKMLKTIKNKSGLVEFLDSTTEYDCRYEYWIEAKATNYSKNIDSKIIKSNSVKVYTPTMSKNINELNNIKKVFA